LKGIKYFRTAAENTEDDLENEVKARFNIAKLYEMIDNLDEAEKSY
jgi:hypothetical protein